MLNKSLFFIFTASVLGGIIYRKYIGNFEIMIDRFGSWVYPPNNFLSRTIGDIVLNFPRFSYSLAIILPDFDLENIEYLKTNTVYIIIMFVAGLIYMISVYTLCFFKFFMGKCGGIYNKRRGYRPKAAFALRYSILLLSFFIVGILFYGYFANSDLHSSLNTLKRAYKSASEELDQQFEQVISNMPASVPNSSEIKADLEYQREYNKYMTDISIGYFSNYESLRLGIYVFNSILATVGCSLGITAGSISGRLPLYIMIGLFAFSFMLFAISSAIHFAGSKTISEFCEAIKGYLEPGNTEYIPGNLQYIIRCFASPYTPIFQKPYMETQLKVFNEQITGCSASGSSGINYFDIDIRPGITCSNITEAKSTALGLRAVSSADTCVWSKDKLRESYFLLCIYSKVNLDMIMLTQFFGGFAIGIITILGVFSVKVIVNAQKFQQKQMQALLKA